MKNYINAWINSIGAKVIRQTEKAFLVRDNDGVTNWIPLSTFEKNSCLMNGKVEVQDEDTKEVIKVDCYDFDVPVWLKLKRKHHGHGAF